MSTLIKALNFICRNFYITYLFIKLIGVIITATEFLQYKRSHLDIFTLNAIYDYQDYFKNYFYFNNVDVFFSFTDF